MDQYTNALRALANGFQEGINKATDTIQAEHDTLRTLRDEIERAEKRLADAKAERASLANKLMRIENMIEAGESEKRMAENRARHEELHRLANDTEV